MEKERKVGTGERWNFIYRMAEAVATTFGEWCNGKDEFVVIEKACLAANRISCDPPLPSSEVKYAVREAVRSVRGKQDSTTN